MLHKTSFISFIRTCMDKIRGKKYKTVLEEFEDDDFDEKDFVDSYEPTFTSVPIENFALFMEDKEKYDSSTITEWIKQGKYNLPPEELEKDKSSLSLHLGIMS